MIKNLFSFETFFVLFLFSSQFKDAYPFFLIPHITLLLTAILIPWFIILYRKNVNAKFLTVETMSFLLFSIWCLISACWVERTTYSISKALCFGVYTVPAFFMAYSIIGANQERLKRFLYAIGILSFWVHLEAYKECVLSHWQWVDVLGSNYLVTGQTLGFGLILLSLVSFFVMKTLEKDDSDEKIALKHCILFWSLMFLCGSYAYIQLHLGGRGPVIGVILTALYFYIYGVYKGESKLCAKHFLHISLCCISIYFFFDWIFEAHTCHFLSRMTKMIVPNEISPHTFEVDESLGLRLEYYESALSAFLKHPLLGLGLGGWAQFHDTLYHYMPEAHDLREVFWRHPHNIGLEVLAETGIIGGMLGIWSGILIFRKILFKQLTRSFLDAAPILLLAFSFFNALKSGDLNDNILFFVMAGISAGKRKHGSPLKPRDNAG
ncbi:MAG: O-antigen ligase family protein [Pseudomonadota bacterium]